MGIKKLLVTVVGGVVFGFLGLFMSPAHADVGPMLVPSEGGALRPGAATDIIMKAEKVTLTYAAPSGTANDPVMKAHVVAEFTMSNPATASKTIDVFFPADDGQYLGNESENLITNLTAGGAKVASTTVSIPGGFDSTTVKAYRWGQAFPAGDSKLVVEYDTVARTRFGMFALTYILGSGRNWAGSIGSGEVDFVLPDNVQTYAVTDKISLMKLNKLGHTISGKTIKVAFTNYEPAANDVVVVGVGNPTEVAKIEKLKQTTPAAFATTLQIAEGIRGLSTGAHCFLCVEPAAKQASDYYAKALNLATTQSQLESALGSYAYGGFTAEDTLANLYDLLAYQTSHPYCSDTDNECNDKTMTLARGTILGSTAEAYRTDFLALYACRLRPFDFTHATLVEDYAGKRLESCPTVAASAQVQPQASASVAKTADKTNWTQVAIAAGGVLAAVIVAILALVLARKHHKKTLTKGASAPTDQPPKEQK